MVTRILTPEINAAIRTCPGKPGKPGMTQRDVARYIVQLDSAHTACKSNLAAVDRSLKVYEESIPN